MTDLTEISVGVYFSSTIWTTRLTKRLSTGSTEHGIRFINRSTIWTLYPICRLELHSLLLFDSRSIHHQFFALEFLRPPASPFRIKCNIVHKIGFLT